MKDKKKLATIIIAVVCVVVVIASIIIQVVLKFADKDLEKEKEKLNTLITKTKSGESIETDYIHVGDNKFYIKVPKNFKQLDYETITKKYSGDIPDVVFSNDETTINVVISLTDNKMLNSGIKDFKDYMEDLLKSNSEIVSTDYYEVDNHNIGKIKVVTKASDTEIYNNMIYFSYKDKLVIVTFNCTIDLKDEWQNVGDFIIDSLFFGEDDDK